MPTLTSRPIRSESDLQCACVSLFAHCYPHLWDKKRFYSIPNGGLRNKIVAARLKKEGAVSGVWDTFLSIPAGKYSGLYLELKWGKNDLTDNQKEFREGNKEDYAFAVAYSQEEFLNAIAKYLRGEGGDIF